MPPVASVGISIHAPRVGSDPAAAAPIVPAEISIHAPRVGSDHAKISVGVVIRISIHAPRVGSDHIAVNFGKFGDDFNPRSPCGERLDALRAAESVDVFQSTLPVWGATSDRFTVYFPPQFQSTLPVWGATLEYALLRASAGDFNPRSPCGERRSWHPAGQAPPGISIHAPRVGSDATCSCSCRRFCYFNPRSPCGERHQRGGAAHAG